MPLCETSGGIQQQKLPCTSLLRGFRDPQQHSSRKAGGVTSLDSLHGMSCRVLYITAWLAASYAIAEQQRAQARTSRGGTIVVTELVLAVSPVRFQRLSRSVRLAQGFPWLGLASEHLRSVCCILLMGGGVGNLVGDVDC